MISLRKTHAVSELSHKTGRPISCRTTVTGFASIAVRILAGVLLLASCASGPGNGPPAESARFPWPPPMPSASTVLPRDAVFRDAPTLGVAAARINAALDKAGYGDRRYFVIKGGFVLLTRIEQTEKDGTPKPPPARWDTHISYLDSFSVPGMLKTFVLAPDGYFQVLAFVVTDEPFNSRTVAASDAEVSHLLASGPHYPPPSVTLTPTAKNTQCTVLVYEFEKSADSKDTDKLFSQKGRMTAQEHLAKASLWTALESTQ